MGGRSLDDEDDNDSDEDDNADPRLQRLPSKNCAFYNTKTSRDIQLSTFHTGLLSECNTLNFAGNSLSDSLKLFGRYRRSLTVLLTGKRLLESYVLDVTKLDHPLSSVNECFIAAVDGRHVRFFSRDFKEKIAASHFKTSGFMTRQMTSATNGLFSQKNYVSLQTAK